MAEASQVPSQGDAAPAATPPAPITTEEIQRMVAAEAQRIVDARIPGLQSSYEKQIASLKKELKKATADPDGYTPDASSELEAQLAQARREADALRAGRQFPDAFPVYEGLMAASSVEEQLELLQEFVRGTAAAPPAAPPAPTTPAAGESQPEAPAPPVDLNNPLEEPAFRGGQMTKSVADNILDSFKEWPVFRG